MLDDIGLGSAIANLISIFILIIALVGGILFFHFKRSLLGIFWISLFLNILSIFYFLGTQVIYIQVINIIIWPIFSLILLILLIFNLAKK